MSLYAPSGPYTVSSSLYLKGINNYTHPTYSDCAILPFGRSCDAYSTLALPSQMARGRVQLHPDTRLYLYVSSMTFQSPPRTTYSYGIIRVARTIQQWLLQCFIQCVSARGVFSALSSSLSCVLVRKVQLPSFSDARWGNAGHGFHVHFCCWGR